MELLIYLAGNWKNNYGNIENCEKSGSSLKKDAVLPV